MKIIRYGRYLMMALLLLGSVADILAQSTSTLTLTGQVVDDEDKPLANVLVESFKASARTYTDLEGSFTLAVAEGEDRLILSLDGFKKETVQVKDGELEVNQSISLQQMKVFGGPNEVTLPYQDFSESRSVSATNVITGEELLSYPSESLIEALSGRLPGVVINNVWASGPGKNAYFSNVRGNIATFYIDGIQRDPTYLSIYEVDRVYVFKDLSSRASLGISAAGPVIWILTKKGESYNREIKVSVEHGVSTPTETPNYVDAYDYAVLRNESNANDGLAPVFSDEALTAYQSRSNPLRYPNVDYYDLYLKDAARFSRANVSFSGGDDKVNFFSMLDYTGNGGLEAVGQQSSYDRYNARANVNLNLTDFISMNVNLAASIVDTKYPNFGGGSYFNLYQYLPGIPASAHANSYNGQLFSSADYTTNVENELTNGFGDGQALNTQNNATINLDLSSLVEGLQFSTTGAFDVNNQLDKVKGGTSAIYRLTQNGAGEDSVFQLTQAAVDPSLGNGYDFYRRVTSIYSRLNYNRSFGANALSAHLSYYQSADETKALFGSEQPLKIQDLSFRANYAFDNKYIAQLDLAYTGSMKLPEGERFNLYPTLGAAWVVSEEAFLKGSNVVNYLKLFGSYGIMGYNSAGGYTIVNGNITAASFGVGAANEFYLSETLWQQQQQGSRTFGTFTDRSATVNAYTIAQQGSTDYDLPKRKYLNLGVQSELFNFVSVEANYFYQNNSGELSRGYNQIPGIFGNSSFVPVANFGETSLQGVDGMVTVSKKTGDFRLSVGLNAIYQRGKYKVVDEPVSLAGNRKRAGTPTDAFRLYISEGLFQSEEEIDSRDVTQSWGAVQPGDIRYTDMNGDGVINEEDMVISDYHRPRIQYGLNVSMTYKGFGLTILGQGQADGHTVLDNPYYFWMQEGEITGSLFSAEPNYSEVMLDRYPVTNDYPRLSTTSDNNYQSSTFWLANAAYLRIKNVELSYTLPMAVSSKMAMSSARLFVRGKNVLVLSELTNKYGVSPENIRAGAGSYPMMKTVTGGITCRF